MVSFIRTIVFLLVFVQLSPSAEAWEVFGVGRLPAHAGLNDKFKTQGDAIFLINNVQRGISQGDIIRFANKAVYIDEEVWNFLKSIQVLDQIQQAPLQHARATAKSSTWSQHAAKKSPGRTQKTYQFGAELLKVMEEYFSLKPGSNEFHIQFHNGKMILMADQAFIDQLRYRRVKIRRKSGPPQIVSLPPANKHFVGEELYWQGWAVASGAPSEDLNYQLLGDLPPGVTWDVKTHSLQGQLDSVGSWELLLIASNAQSQKDSLKFNIITRTNQAPQFGSHPSDTIYTEELYRYSPHYYDRDHAGEELEFRYETSHNNFNYNKHTQKFYITPDEDMDGEIIQLDMMVMDPQGDTTYLNRKIQVLSQTKKIQTQNLNTSIPFDTLITHHTYTWDVSAALREIKSEKMRVVDVIGPDTLWFHKNKIQIHPKQAGVFPVEFFIQAGKDTIEFKKQFVVINNQKPQFYSRLDKNQFQQDEDIIHNPVALDPDGDPVQIQVARASDTASYRWVDGRLEFITEFPGHYHLELQAQDSTGATSYQLLQWEVMEIDKDWLGAQYYYSVMGDFQYHQLGYENAMGRFGILSSQTNKIFNSSRPYQIYPFLFAGINLLGRERAREGDFFFLDLGISFRKPHSQLISGGVMTGISSRKHYFGKSWVSDFEMKMIANQVIMLIDTAGIMPETISLNNLIDLSEGNRDLNETQREDLETYQSSNKGDKLREVAKLIVSEYMSPDNIQTYFRFENLIALQPWLLVGPSQQFKYYHNAKTFYISNGLVGRHWIYGKYYRLEQNLRLHYAPQTKYQFGYDVKLSFGAWDWVSNMANLLTSVIVIKQYFNPLFSI